MGGALAGGAFAILLVLVLRVAVVGRAVVPVAPRRPMMARSGAETFIFVVVVCCAVRGFGGGCIV